MNRFLACILILLTLNLRAADGKHKQEEVRWGAKDEAYLTDITTKLPPQTLAIPRVAKGPVIDGVDDDACWKDASVISFLTSSKGIGNKPPLRFGVDGVLARNEVRLAYDDKYLYVHMTCWEHLMPMLVVSTTERDGAVWKDDDVEVFIGPARDKLHEFHAIVNPLGTLYDASEAGIGRESKGDRSWNYADAQIVTKRYDDRWTVEARFDFASLGGAPKPGAAWSFDICRQRRASGIEGIWTYATWSGSPNGFSGHPDLRGDLVFGDTGMTADQLERPFLGRNTFGAQVIRPQHDLKLQPAVTLIYDDNGRMRQETVKADPVVAKAGAVTEIHVPFTVTREGIQFAMLELYDADGKALLRARRGFTVDPVRRQLAAISPGLDALLAKAKNPGFIASMQAYRQDVTALEKEVAAFVADATAKPPTPESREAWGKLYERVRAMGSRTTYLVWAKSPYLETASNDFPAKLEDVASINVRAAQNEYEVAGLMVTNLTNEYLDMIVRDSERVPGLMEVRSPVMTDMKTVVEESPAAFDFDTVRGFNLPGETGEPLPRLGSYKEIVVPPLATRQLLLVFHTAGMRAKAYDGRLRIFPLNEDIAPKQIAVHLQVDDFEIPTVAALGVHVYNYGGTDAEKQDMIAHKVNTWFLEDNGRFSIKNGKFVHSTKGMADKWKKWLADPPGARKGWAYGIVIAFYKFAQKHPKELPYMSDAYKDAFKQVVKDMVEVGKEAGLSEDQIMICCWDEVKGSDIDIVVDHLKLLKEVAPKLKVALTTQIGGADRDKLDGYIDVWNPAGGYVWDSGRLISRGWKQKATGFYDKQQDKGCLIWPYQCSTPVRGMAPLGYYRMYGWRALDAQVDGISFFAWSYLVYRDNGEVIPTRGWEAFREGIEDWQYGHRVIQEIGRLRAAGKTAPADEAAASLVDIMARVMANGDHPRDEARTDATIDQARGELADLILKLKKTR